MTGPRGVHFGSPIGEAGREVSLPDLFVMRLRDVSDL